MAHRGFQSQYPENTMAAFSAAVKAGAQYLEMDVSFTRDSQVVVIHDDTVDRTTNGTGPVHGYLLKELKQLDAGSWFHPQFAQERIPTLGEVLDRFAGKICLNIEIKAYDQAPEAGHDHLENAVVDLVRRKKKQACVLISSFDSKVLHNVKTLDHATRVAFISKYFVPDETLDLCMQLAAFSYHPNLSFLKKDQVVTMHREGFQVFPYNINNAEDIYHALELEVDGLISKDPHLVQSCYTNLLASKKTDQ
jgi:glycerophosphoryl diester phosphodiesterase